MHREGSDNASGFSFNNQGNCCSVPHALIKWQAKVRRQVTLRRPHFCPGRILVLYTQDNS